MHLDRHSVWRLTRCSLCSPLSFPHAIHFFSSLVALVLIFVLVLTLALVLLFLVLLLPIFVRKPARLIEVAGGTGTLGHPQSAWAGLGRLLLAVSKGGLTTAQSGLTKLSRSSCASLEFAGGTEQGSLGFVNQIRSGTISVFAINLGSAAILELVLVLLLRAGDWNGQVVRGRLLLWRGLEVQLPDVQLELLAGVLGWDISGAFGIVKSVSLLSVRETLGVQLLPQRSRALHVKSQQSGRRLPRL